jgi:DNA ligase-1
MLAHALDEMDCAAMPLEDFRAEWKWDGIRVQASVGTTPDGRKIVNLFSRTGEDISNAFPDLVATLSQEISASYALDGELLIVRDGRTQPFGVLQQRLNRKLVSAKLLADYPAHIRAYDILALDGEDLRSLPFDERRRVLEKFIAAARSPRLDLSPLIAAKTWDDLAAARHDPASAGAGVDAGAIEGIMLKRAASPYLSGRPKGHWFKWKRDPATIDAVLMYAQRGHGKRSSLYSDYTFGVWHNHEDEEALVPVGKAYFGFTDAELRELDLYVRNHTINRFGPVREVTHGKDGGLVLEIAFEGLNRSTRHKSGLAMRFPRISRIRWDKPAHEADRIETLEAMLKI